MIERIKEIKYKETSTKKINKYTWVGIVDRDGRVLKNRLLDIPDYWDWFKELEYDSSQYLIDVQERYKGVNLALRSNFFKYVDPEIGIKYMEETDKEHGRFDMSTPENKNLYVFITMADAMYTNELFSRGVLWMHTSLETLNNYIPTIDSIRILRLNHSFKELFPDEELEILNFDDVYKKAYELSSRIRTPNSEKYLKQSETYIKEKVAPEFWDNGMKIIRKETDSERKQKNEIPEIWDYYFEEYDWVNENRISSDTVVTEKTQTIEDLFSIMR